MENISECYTQSILDGKLKSGYFQKIDMAVIWKLRSDGVLQRFNTSPLRPKIVDLYNAGFPSRIVAEKVGISHARVLQLLEKEGVNRRMVEKPIANPKYRTLTPERAYIIGVMCGDGCLFSTLVRKKQWVYRQYAVNLAVRDLDFAQEFARCLNAVYGLTINIGFQKRKDKNPKCSDIWVASSKRKAIFQDLAQYRFGVRTWEVPQEILDIEDERIIGAFLRGYFDSEGSVSVGKRGAAIMASSTNRAGLECVKELLMTLGIGVSEIKEDTRADRNKCFYLYITHRNNYRLFLQKVGFSIKRKEERLNQYLRGLKNENLEKRENASLPSRSDI